MIKVEELPNISSGLTMHEHLHDAKGTKDKIARAINVIKTLDINGCITGSVFLPNFDPDMWGTKPDIDVFVYSKEDLIHAIDIVMYDLKMKPGKGTKRSADQELWKLRRLHEWGLNHKIGITTYTFNCDGIMINITYKQTKRQGRWEPLINCPSVLMSFDMSIVMRGYDIQSHVMFDLRPEDVPVTTAVPNPLRKHDCMMWTVAKWIRQFDRVIKYYDRGFDTRPMARFYLEMIDECIEAGCLFDSEESQNAFNSFSKEFLEKRAVIKDWLDEHEED